MMKIIIKSGDIFKVKISDNEACYLQYLANDINQLNGNVIRIFKDRYKNEDTPSAEKIINGKIDFYCHVFLKRGVHLGFWTKYAHSDNVGDLKQVYFKNYIDALPWSTYWYAWNIYDNTLKEYKKSNPVHYRKLVKLLNELMEHPRTGTGQYWS